MERLTEWRGEHAAVVEHHANYIDRLAAYEDTGLTPEQIRNAKETLECFDNIGIKRGNEIVRAEQEGRLVILPIPIGSDFRRMDYPENLALRRNVRPAIQTTGIDWPGGYDVEGFMPLHVVEEYMKSGNIVAVDVEE